MRVLVLGGGSSQINLIKRTRESGHEVVLADMDGNAPGRRWADRFVQVSTFDVDGVSAAVRTHGIEAVITAGTDQPVLTAAVASDRANLFHPLSPKTAKEVTNKREMKRALRDAGIPTAPWRIIPKTAAREAVESFTADTTAPWVVKPLDSQGQRGVMKLSSPEAVVEALPYVRSFSREEDVLMEEYYPSREITVSGWVCTGEPRTFAVVDRVTRENNRSIGVCVAHRYPSSYLERYAVSRREIDDLTRRIVSTFGIESGPLYFQYLLGARGVIVNEIACRLGGAYEDLTQPAALGIDPVHYLLESLGEPGGEYSDVSEDVRRLYGGATHRDNPGKPFSVALLFAQPGRVEGYGGVDAAERIPGVIEVRFLLPPGTVIRDIANSTQRIGYAIVVGESARAVDGAVGALFDTLAVYAPDGTNLLINTARRCMLSGDE